MSKVIMVQGTMSNAGKSLLVAGLCRIFKQDGYRVAPFKSQNMALNSFITKEGLEMGRAQVMQAEAAGIEPSVLMNPILLKPTNHIGSQVIVNGEVLGNMNAKDYFAYKKQLIPDIKKAFCKLEEENDIIVIEGAGSPAEINLRENDIVNMGLAEIVDAPVLLVGDIDRGGVFAQLLGTLLLLEESEKERVQGLIINKFRGDQSILDSGVIMLEEKGQVPVVGVVPYMTLSVEDEDSLSTRFDHKDEGIIDIAVIKYPRISNFTDLDVFEQFDQVSVRYIDAVSELHHPDLIILPGSKNTMSDLKWMRQNGLEAAIKKKAEDTLVFGICGGYQMLGEGIEDPFMVEEGGSIRGIELLPVQTVLEKTKTRTQVTGNFEKLNGALESLSEKKIQGYEIHMGTTTYTEKTKPIVSIDREGMEQIKEEKSVSNVKIDCKTNFVYEEKAMQENKSEQKNNFIQDGCQRQNVYGTYVHGIFDHEEVAKTVIEILAKRKGIEIDTSGLMNYETFKQMQYDKLAEGLRNSLDMDKVYGMLREAAI